MGKATIELDELIGQHKQQLVEQVQKGLIERVGQQIGWTAEAKIKEEVEKFVVDEILPEIHTYLTDHRAEIVDQTLNAIKEVFAALATSVAAKGIKNMSNEYKVRGIIKEIFADY